MASAQRGSVLGWPRSTEARYQRGRRVPGLRYEIKKSRSVEARIEVESSGPEEGLVGGEGDSLGTTGTYRLGEGLVMVVGASVGGAVGTSIGGPRREKEGGWLGGGVENQMLLYSSVGGAGAFFQKNKAAGVIAAPNEILLRIWQLG